MSNTHRFIARMILEAKTGLFVGSGETSLLKDAIVQKDHLGLPMIQGTSLAGVLSHAFLDAVDFTQDFSEEKEWLIQLWGYQLFGKEKDAFVEFYKKKFPNKREEEIPKGFGSRLKISSAYLVTNDNKVSEGFETNLDETILNKFDNLPSRQHVKITDKGVAAKQGLFNNEIVYAGTRFIFEIELIGNKSDENYWENILTQMYQPSFRLGQGTRKGYGKLAVLSISQRIYDLKNSVDFEDYSNFDPSFNAKNKGFSEFSEPTTSEVCTYKLNLKPDQFFIFSEGSGDDKVDNKPMEEEIVYYENNQLKFSEQRLTLIPATSIKGAIAHRTAFYYNKLNNRWAGTTEAKIGNDNEAVKILFGFEAKDETGERGHVLIDDVYFNKQQVSNDKIFNHVAIDRFTGGALDGALFSEKVSRFTSKDSELEILVSIDKDNIDAPIIHSLEEALKDICKGLLPLGGMTTKGHGIFTGKLLKNGKEIYRYEN